MGGRSRGRDKDGFHSHHPNLSGLSSSLALYISSFLQILGFPHAFNSCLFMRWKLLLFFLPACLPLIIPQLGIYLFLLFGAGVLSWFCSRMLMRACTLSFSCWIKSWVRCLFFNYYLDFSGFHFCHLLIACGVYDSLGFLWLFSVINITQ